MNKPLLTIVMCFGMLAGCKHHHDNESGGITYAATPLQVILPVELYEASGIAPSSSSPGSLWVEQDSGNPPVLSLMNTSSGTILHNVYIKAATNRDWEDIALAAGPVNNQQYIYVGDIGNNDATAAQTIIYRFPEPSSSTDTVFTADRISFTYADGPRDAEAFIVDDSTLDIFIITKRENASRIYKLTYPYSTSASNVAAFVGVLPYTGVVSAAASSDRTELLVKTYGGIWHYQKAPTQPIDDCLLHTAGTALAYQLELQGEAVSFSLDNQGFFTLSEMPAGQPQALYFYGKN